jgi:hypothetical protein
MTFRLPILLQDPAVCKALTPSDWRDALAQFKESGLLAHLAELLAAREIASDAFPPAVRRQLVAHRATSAALIRSARWECGELSRAFAGSGIAVMLLKGASYAMSDALPARGRFVGDVDILVRRESLADAERLLRAGGWLPAEKSPEDEQYVREWQHQLPPFQHQERLTIVDLHHTIIASGGGHHLDVDRLFANARPLASSVLLVPSDLDQCLIVAAHFLRSGSADSAFRDLLDFTELLAECSDPATVNQRLLDRAREIGLADALRVTSHFASALFGTPVFGRPPVCVGMRADALLPSGTVPASRMKRLLRRLHGIAATRAAVPWRVMLARTLRRRLRGEPTQAA